MQQNNLAGPSDQIEPEIELVSDDGKVEVIIFLVFSTCLLTKHRVALNDQNMVVIYGFRRKVFLLSESKGIRGLGDSLNIKFY